MAPGSEWTLEAPGRVGANYLAGWKKYDASKGKWEAGSFGQETSWVDVEGIEGADGIEVTVAADEHAIYAPVYEPLLILVLPMTGGSAATTWLLIGGGLAVAALIGMALIRRRKAATA